jgi:hypothetical protein
MAEHGHDTRLAEQLLQTMQSTLHRMYEHRALIEAAIAAGRQCLVMEAVDRCRARPLSDRLSLPRLTERLHPLLLEQPF